MHISGGRSDFQSLMNVGRITWIAMPAGQRAHVASGRAGTAHGCSARQASDPVRIL
jgi:hypothetical protein